MLANSGPSDDLDGVVSAPSLHLDRQKFYWPTREIHPSHVDGRIPARWRPLGHATPPSPGVAVRQYICVTDIMLLLLFCSFLIECLHLDRLASCENATLGHVMATLCWRIGDPLTI